MVNKMIKKIIGILICLSLLVTCFAGCSDDDENIYLSYAIGEMPEHFDPQIASSQGERIVACNIFDGLFKLDEKGEPQNCAITEYTVSADGLTYDFTLSEGMQYYISDEVKDFLEEKEVTISAEVTAEDFVFGITRAILPETDSPDYELLSAIKNARKVHEGDADKSTLGISVTGKYSFRILLERKDPNLLYALSQPVSYPCDEEFFNLTAGRYGLDEEYIISNGAFYLSDISDGESVRFSRVEDYKGLFKATPTSVRLYLNTSETDIAKKVDDGTYDMGLFTSPEAIDELGRRVQKTELENILNALVFNMSDEVLQNTPLRRGLVSCIDKTNFTDTPVNTPTPSYYKPGSKSVEGISYNIGTARDNMIKAFEELEIDTLTVDVLCTEADKELAKAIVNCWQANIGVELNGTVTVVGVEDFDSKIGSGEFDCAICSFSANSDRVQDFLSLFTTDNPTNICRYSSEEYDRIVEELKKSPTVKNADYCRSYLMKNAVLMPISFDSAILAVAKNSTGIYLAGDSSNIYFYKGQN